MSMPYSIMVWLVDPGEELHDLGHQEDRRHVPGAASGFTAPPPARCLSYGLFANEIDLEEALLQIGESLRRGSPLRISHGSRTFIIPVARIHYVVCDQVTRPVDARAADAAAAHVEGGSTTS
jgi:hypothetical protein